LLLWRLFDERDWTLSNFFLPPSSFLHICLFVCLSFFLSFFSFYFILFYFIFFLLCCSNRCIYLLFIRIIIIQLNCSSIGFWLCYVRKFLFC
jgi:hypothetical protein